MSKVDRYSIIKIQKRKQPENNTESLKHVTCFSSESFSGIIANNPRLSAALRGLERNSPHPPRRSGHIVLLNVRDETSSKRKPINICNAFSYVLSLNLMGWHKAITSLGIF